MKQVFADTGFFIAVRMSNDNLHARALQGLNRLKAWRPTLVTTDLVLVETINHFAGRGAHRAAVQFWDWISSSETVELVQADANVWDRAWKFFAAHDDKGYSFTDCASFIVMKELGITDALTFDRHFVQAGFTALP